MKTVQTMYFILDLSNFFGFLWIYAYFEFDASSGERGNNTPRKLLNTQKTPFQIILQVNRIIDIIMILCIYIYL